MSTTKTRPVVLTGDRTTGSLHLGHYVGSLKRRLELQEDHRQFLLLADAQALTDNADDPARISGAMSARSRSTISLWELTRRSRSSAYSRAFQRSRS